MKTLMTIEDIIIMRRVGERLGLDGHTPRGHDGYASYSVFATNCESADYTEISGHAEMRKLGVKPAKRIG